MTIASTGCGRLNFDPTLDAEAIVPRCDPSAPFTSVTEITSLSSAYGDGGLRLSSDELTAYYHSDRTPLTAYGIWTATRGAIGEPFGPSTWTGIDGYFPSVSPDGLTLAYDDAKDLFITSRSDTTVGFAPASGPFPALTTGTDEMHAFLTADSVYFMRAGDLYVSTLPAAVDLIALGVINTVDNEYMPVLSADGLTLYYDHDTATASEQVWVARRETTAEPFGTPKAVPELIDPDNTGPTWLSPDNCRLYLESNRPGGDYNLWVAERIP